jgi:hypothetical protein
MRWDVSPCAHLETRTSCLSAQNGPIFELSLSCEINFNDKFATKEVFMDVFESSVRLCWGLHDLDVTLFCAFFVERLSNLELTGMA